MEHIFPEIAERCYINVPFPRLQNELERVLANNIHPEIGLDGDTLYATPPQEFASVAAALKKAGRRCTLHAPFSDLSPGASDPYIREASVNKLKKALGLIPLFTPVSVVCHLNYVPDQHEYSQEEWLKNSLASWGELLELAQAGETPLMLENTYEKTPLMHEQVLGALNSPYARFCLDVGHTMAFAGNSWQDWLPHLTPWLGQLHLHDNHGDRDSHLAVGSGKFDFAGLFDYLRSQHIEPLITLEPHNEKTLFATLEGIHRLKLLA